MAYEFRLQDPGEGIHEAEIVEIIVSEGQHVKEGENILIAETDKAAVEIPSPVTGKIAELKVSEGDIVEVGSVLAVLNEDDAETEENESEEETASEDEDETGEDTDTDTDVKDESEAGPEKSVEAERIASDGSQEEQDSTKKEQKAKSEKNSQERKESHEEDTSGSQSAEADGRARSAEEDESDVLATPAVRGLARKLEIDLTKVQGSGENQRILEDDVLKAADSATPSGKDDEKQAPADKSEEGTERIKLRSIRRSTAKQMSRAWREIPHVTHLDEIDITDLEKLRRDHAGEAEKSGAKLTLTPFIMKALAGSLSQHPRFNARFDAENEEIEMVHDVNIGVALDTERGLLVPVIRDIQSRTVLDLAEELARISDKLKNQRADRAMLQGGTITLTNVGSIGGTGFVPIINPPQVAIFGAARAGLRNVPAGDIERTTTTTRLILPVCLSFDHRVNDGADAARFMNSVKLLLSDPEQFALRS
jgi:pyruvate dehydrogenase E2 component (dihydrolipoamide acetyltransferase)